MLNYLEKFKNLPLELRERISGPAVMAEISALEKKYGLNLATVVMRVAVNDISLLDLPKFFVFENDMDGRQAEKLTEELKKRVFNSVGEYLGIAKEEPVMIITKDKMVDNTEGQLDSWMQERKNEAAVRGSSFFFSAEDEEEVKNLAKKVADFNVEKTKPEQKPLDYNLIIDKAVKGMNISFSSDDLRTRFRNVMTTYLRGIRSKVDIKQALIRDINSGGLGVSAIYADNIISFTEKIKAEIIAEPAKIAQIDNEEQDEKSVRNIAHPFVSPAVKEKTLDIAGGARDIDYDYKNMPSLKDREAAITGTAGEKKPFAENKQNTEKKEMIMPSITLDNKQESLAAPKKEAIAADASPDKNIVIGHALYSAQSTPPIKRPRSESGKIKIEDVKHVPKLVGPLDELMELDLINFRRIGLDPGERVRKIKDKISFLEEESYGQRLAGIKAWRHSPVNTLYLDIGRESISTHIGIDAIINARRDKGIDYLTEEEFAAIMSLNKYLRY